MDAKPCPFCGTEPVSYAGYGAMNITCARCSYSVPSVIWNFRPIEDALTALLRQVLADATVPASAVELAKTSLEVISLRSCVRALEVALEQAMAPHDDPENAMHCACVPALKGRIAELESAIAYTDGRNPVTVVVELQQRIRELEAELAEDAAVLKWTRITNDPATWPPDNDGLVMYAEYVQQLERYRYHTRLSYFLHNDCSEWDNDSTSDYWLPITPPQP